MKFKKSLRWHGIKWDDALRMAVKRALVISGIIVESNASRMVPVDIGRLKGSITYAVQGYQQPTKSPLNEADDAVSQPDDEYTVHIGSNVNYAPYVEYGTRRMDAQPYLRPAFDNNRDNIVKAFAAEIVKEIESRAQ